MAKRVRAKLTKPRKTVDEQSTNFSVILPADTVELLGMVATRRKRVRGGRYSAGQVVRDLIDANKTALKKEAAGK